MNCGECSDLHLPANQTDESDREDFGGFFVKPQNSLANEMQMIVETGSSRIIGEIRGDFEDESDEDDEEISTLPTRSGRPTWRDKRISKSRSAYTGLATQAREEYEDDTSDSDAEFRVHAVGMTKTKSEYAFPEAASNTVARIKAHRTDFEMNLEKMLASVNRSFVEESEAPVANFTEPLDKIWPEPDSPRERRTVRSKSHMPTNNSDRLEVAEKASEMSCWSSPANILLEDQNLSSPEGSAYCWSAPEFLVDEDTDCSDACEYERKRTVYGRKPETLFARSYPQIDSPDQDPARSIASIRLPSTDSSPIVSQSPSRPQSPIFGRPANKVRSQKRIPISRSLHIHHIQSDSELAGVTRCTSPHCQGVQGTDSEEEEDERLASRSPIAHPQEEVWPEEEVLFRNERLGWSPSTYRLPKSQSVYEALVHLAALPHSRSAHGGLTIDCESGFDPRESMEGSSTHSMIGDQWLMDGGERREFDSRRLWIQRGSNASNHHQASMMWAQEMVNHQLPYHQGEMRRSATVAEGFSRAPLHRNGSLLTGGQPRRRLPKAPPQNYGTVLPCSVSMYGRMLGDDAEYSERFDCRLPQQNMSDSYDFLLSTTRGIPPVNQQRNYGSMHFDSEAENEAPVNAGRQARPPDLPLRAIHPATTVPRSPLMDVSPLPHRDPYADIATPMSPPLRVLPSPLQGSFSSSGRRLPALPIHSSVLRDLPPPQQQQKKMMNSHSLLGQIHPTTSTIHQQQQQQQQHKNDHRLCYGMDASLMARSALEDSYFEEDGMNGNSGYAANRKSRKSFFSPEDSSGVSSCAGSDSLNPTHRVQSAFYPRHNDEVLLEMGDAVHVDRTCEDNWCYGTNLRTGQIGIFPHAVVCEIDLVDEICQGALPTNAQKVLQEERDTFYLTMLGSIEVAHHKGNDVLIQAVNKMLGMYKNRDETLIPQTVLMEVSFRGIHVIDKKKKNFFQCPSFDFFYSLQNISFCGAHPKQLKYFGFITKHPLLPRFACHVFVSNESTQQIVESIGRAFKRSYDEYMAFAHPTEDIYLE